ncbi:hypothetical protein [Streptomyces globisporus]|uniref:hypothetical protein n=1 Tax=Streptomyces globisporus TaxID=1908 RepID=UPI00068FBB07|nr:hypothetical protein [Streptomyces globisporus]
MIKNLVRGVGALSLALFPLAPHHTALAAPTEPTAAEVLTLAAAIGQIPVADESRDGYVRTKFKHWNAGLDLGDSCSARNEVLLAEAVESPDVTAGCKLTGGRRISYYDGQEVTDPGKLDIDPMVPLAEAWDSGASAWDAKRREAYANDQDAATSLVAVTARSNRQKIGTGSPAYHHAHHRPYQSPPAPLRPVRGTVWVSAWDTPHDVRCRGVPLCL